MPKLKSQQFSSYIPESAGLRSFATRQNQDTPPRTWPDVDIKDFLEPAWETLKKTPRNLIENLPTFPPESLKQNFNNVSSTVHESFTKFGNNFVECFRCTQKESAGEVEEKQSHTTNMKRTEWWNSCFCLRGSEAPKIEHILADSPALVPMQPLPSLPEWEKLEPEELQSKVLELLDELDLTTSQKNGILNFPPEKQLQLLYSHNVQSSSQKVDRPEAYIAKLDEYTSLREPFDEYQLTTWLKYTNGLKTALATHSNTFVGEFVEAGGLASLLGFLEAMDEEAKEGPMHTNLVACIKALMNNSNGRRHILAHRTCLSIITQSLVTTNVRTQTMVLEILGGVCLLPGGHKKILEAMLHYQRFASERTRFQTLVNMLDQYRGNYIELVTLKIAIMSFINAVIRWGPGEESLEFRLHLRYEFLMLGLQPILDKLRSLENDILDTHLDAFEFYRAEDEREWARRFEELHVDTKSASSMFKLLQSRLQYSSAYPHFLSLLHHLLLLTPGDLTSPDRWLLFDRILQQLITQDMDGKDKEIAVIDINVQKIVKLLASEQELLESRQKISRLEADNADAITELNIREQKIYQLTQEKEVAEGALQQMLIQVEVEAIKCQTIESQKSQLEMQILNLTEQINQMAKGASPNAIVNNLQNLSPTSPGFPPPPPPLASVPPPPPPCPASAPLPPPCPPMMNGIGPPPPPPMQMPSKIAKKIPKSTTQLRAFNWSKLPESRVAGTVFAALDESSLYKALDLEDIDKTFDSSTTRKGMSDGEKTLERMRTMKSSNFTVLEGRRQQNCAILLSKLKLSNNELLRVLLNMDADYQLAPDMVEQLLKFTPTAEEKSMLEEHGDEIAMYSTADRFLYEISKLNHYEQRLTCLLYQKKYKERVGECEPKITAIFAAAKEVHTSKKLKRLLELVLAFGNYMNKGQRGGAFGFRISSLNKLADVRATTDRSLTLLHYIIKVCSQQWPDLLNLPKDLISVHEAAKVNLTELQKDIKALEEGLSFIDKEVTWHRAQAGAAPGDRFRIVMTEFSGIASEKLSTLQSQFKDMKAQLDRVMKMFGEDPNTQQPEDFFGYFDTFLESFKDAYKDLEATKKKEEEEARKKKELEERERRAKERKQQRLTSSTTNGPSANSSPKGGCSTDEGNDFDELISALRSGDVFGKDIDKMRRKKRHSIGTRNPDRDRA